MFADDGVSGVDYANVDDRAKSDNAVPKAKPNKLNSGCN